MLSVRWGDRLERLADDLFDRAAEPSSDPFLADCVVVNSPVMPGWLKQHFLFDRRGPQRVLANCEFVYLPQFVNDGLASLHGEPTEQRQAALHPYSKDCLRWRIYRLLESRRPGLEALRAYVGPDGPGASRRRFGLAGQLARLFDDYQCYRADQLMQWRRGVVADLEPGLRWQPALWNALLDDDPHSYLATFLDLETACPGDAIRSRYRRVAVFNVSSMPPPYLWYFERLAETVDVTFYLLNPSRADWFDDPTPRQAERLRGASHLTGGDDSLLHLDTPNPLLSGLGKGCQSYLAELMDRTEGRAADDAFFGDDASTTLLEHLQAQIRDRAVPTEGTKPRISDDDESVQFHVCHSPLREVEVLRDQLRAWFQADPNRQPRSVQVLVADLTTYAPYIDAVFLTDNPFAPTAIPYEVADRADAGTGPVATAFTTLLHLPEHRFAASEVMGLLEVEAVRDAFGLSLAAVDALRNRVRASGIRWGVDGAHVASLLGCASDDGATWRRGMDRLLLGYAMGRSSEGAATVEAGELGEVLPWDDVEGDSAASVGLLGRFVDALRGLMAQFSVPCAPAEWTRRLETVVQTFFRSTNDTYGELTLLRRAIHHFGDTASAYGDEPLSSDVVAAAVEAQLASPSRSGLAARNAVLFTSLATMRATPRPLIYLLGVNDGSFPRADDRPAFDLMARKRYRGDRSPRLDDRLAFLEAILCTRQRLVISYTGRSDQSNELVPPSTVVSELVHYLRECFAMPTESGGERHLRCERWHPLQAFHPDYFRAGGRLFSYSADNCEAARCLQAPPPTPSVQRAPVQGATLAVSLSLRDLQQFFRNPARSFLLQVLKVRLEDPRDGALSDAEMFVADDLEAYTRGTLVLEHLLAGRAPEPLLALLRESGLTPLGAPGRLDAETLVANVADYLAAACPVADATVSAVLERSRAAVPMPWRCRVGGVDVVGEGALVALPIGPSQVMARFAGLKAKDRVVAWIAHLLGHAAGAGPFDTVLLGKDAHGPVAERMRAIPATDAQRFLQSMVDLFQRGQAAALPFAPETSLAYAKALDEEGVAAATAKARAKWRGNVEVRGETGDAYLRSAWHLDGPMLHPDFADCALAFWGPHLTAGGPP